MGQLSVIRVDSRPYKLIMMWGGAGWLVHQDGKRNGSSQKWDSEGWDGT